MTTPGDIDSALEALRARDPGAGQNAEAALEALTAGEGFDHVNQHYLQYFLWYTLPKKFLVSLDVKLDIAWALGDVLADAGMPRYAAICRSDTTRGCIEAEEYGRGREVYLRAQKASGVEPPDTDLLVWGDVFGSSENAALEGAASALEMAIVGGELSPGSSGWKGKQKSLTTAWLTAPNPAFDGDTPLDAIHSERMGSWMRGRSEAKRRLFERLVGRLGTAPRVPDEIEHAFAPLRWFLARAEEGIPLTEKYNLGRAFVREAAARWNWWDLRGQPMREDDVTPLWILHEYASELKLVRRRGRKLLATPVGRRCQNDAEELWHRVGRGLVRGQEFVDAVSELTLAVLVLEGEMEADDIVTTITPMLVEEGWGSGKEWGPRVLVDEEDVSAAMWDLRRRSIPFGLMVDREDWRDRSVALTEVGRATALDALRARATAPQRGPY